MSDAVRRVGLLRLAVSEEEAEHVRGHVAALREDGFPARSSSARTSARAAARGLVAASPDARRRASPGALVPRARAAAEAAGARICEDSPRAGPADEGPVGTDEAASAPATWWWPPTARCRRSCRSTAGACASPAAHGRHRRRSRRRSTTLVYARWGYEYLQQRPRRAHPRGGFSDVDARDSYTDSDAAAQRSGSASSPTSRDDLGATAPRSPIAGPAWSATATTRCPTWARCRAARASTCRAATPVCGNVPGFMCGRDLADTIAGDGPEPLFPAGRGPWTGSAYLRARARARRSATPRERRALRGDAPPRRALAGRRRLVVLSSGASRGRCTWRAARAHACGTWTGTSTSTSTTASARWCRATRTRPSPPRWPGRAAARHPLRRAPPRTRWRWPRSSCGASGSPRWRFTNSGTESIMDAIRHRARLTPAATTW